MPPALGLADISQMDGAHPRFWAWIPPSWPQGKEFPHSGWGREGFDARRGGPGRLRAASGLTTAPRGRTPGAARPPAACRCPLRASAWDRLWQPQPRDPVEEVAEQLARHGHLGHLEDRVPPVGDYLRADLDHLLSQRGKGPPLDLTG